MSIGGIAIQNPSIDTIAVFNGFTQVFVNARPLKDEVVPRAKIMDHPTEAGQIISDYKITLPVEITIPVIIQAQYYRDTYQEIWNLWQTSTVLIVQTRVGSFGNMVITEPPHNETPEKFDAIVMELKFRMVLTPAQQPAFTPADPTQADTQNNGQQNQTTTYVPGTATVPYNGGEASGVATFNSSQLNTQQNISSSLNEGFW